MRQDSQKAHQQNRHFAQTDNYFILFNYATITNKTSHMSADTYPETYGQRQKLQWENPVDETVILF